MPMRVARKAHRCIWCGGELAKGTPYLDERSVYDGHFQQQRWHPECHAYSAVVADSSGEFEFIPYGEEYPPKEWIDENWHKVSEVFIR